MYEITEIIIRTSVVYIAIIAGLRLLGKQHLGQITINDFVLIMLISNAVQNAMVGNNTSVTGGLVAAITLIILSYLFSSLIYKSVLIRKIIMDEQTILIYDGNYLEDNLRKCQITYDELESIMRKHGIEMVSEIHSAIMESDGEISIIPVAKGEKPKIYKHHRQKENIKKYKKF
jgi:uncharacterized membrane protein YcaP (DUF421 family)